jgi:hypothetical protein
MACDRSRRVQASGAGVAAAELIKVGASYLHAHFIIARNEANRRIVQIGSASKAGAVEAILSLMLVAHKSSFAYDALVLRAFARRI